MNFKLLLLTFTFGVFATEPERPFFFSSQFGKPNPTITFNDTNGTSHTLSNNYWESNYAAIQARSKLETRFRMGGFLDKYKNVRYYLAKLVAECLDKNGNYICTWLELGKCLVNLDEELAIPGGNFHESCTQCNIRENGRWFNCGCWTKLPKGTIQWTDIKERLKRTTIDLNVAIGAQDGYLYCHGNWGSKTFAAEDLRMILSRSSVMTVAWRRTAGSRAYDGGICVLFFVTFV
ncbi:unnamed protein product [Fusarium venenatum]|uniref:Cyanovirin-N domain-containing protein n=1 Tax=Fusarium venenatum TaxID=56646 RepID=A0A2L2TBX4_9HYPO|nr:uncharacterized protein FVRRES_02015 [Fusarium venenatum]KAH7004845.1 Cyanovirin-N [Fusarium venenatum]CEI65503.1 unnamed protein product [Fusarium venenatum]